MHKEGIVSCCVVWNSLESPHMNLSWTCTSTEPEVGKTKKNPKNPVISPGLNNPLARVHARIPRSRKERCKRASEVVIIVDDFHLFHLFDPPESLCAH